MNADALRELLNTALPDTFECSVAPQGVRVRTSFLYADGDYVDVFVLDQGDSCLVTEHGESLWHLRTQTTNLSDLPRERLADILDAHNVQYAHGSLQKLVPPDPALLTDAILAVAETASKVSNMRSL